MRGRERLIRDVGEHKASTVAELLAFMRDYRLLARLVVAAACIKSVCALWVVHIVALPFATSAEGSSFATTRFAAVFFRCRPGDRQICGTTGTEHRTGLPDIRASAGSGNVREQPSARVA